jgi:hypothetical protein
VFWLIGQEERVSEKNDKGVHEPTAFFTVGGEQVGSA